MKHLLYVCIGVLKLMKQLFILVKFIKRQEINLIIMKKELPIPDLHEAIDYLAQEGDVSRIELLMRKALDRAFEEKKTVIDICSMIFDIFISLKIYLTKSCQEEALKIFRRMSIWTFLCCGTEKNYMILYIKN